MGTDWLVRAVCMGTLKGTYEAHCGVLVTVLVSCAVLFVVVGSRMSFALQDIKSSRAEAHFARCPPNTAHCAPQSVPLCLA